MKIVLVSGARPNYMKIAPIVWALRRFNQSSTPRFQTVLIHTGQHYDRQLFEVFFQELDLPAPNYSLGVGSGSHAFQIAEVMKRIEPVLAEQQPSLVLVVGDVNSTLAAALTAVKLRIPVAHVEAGLRSFDRTMPEEINRLLTDAISEFLFVTEESGRQNLLHEGIDAGKVYFVGNVMIDSLKKSQQMWEHSRIHDDLRLKKREYGVVTLHRPSNVDSVETFKSIIGAIGEVSKQLPLVFPVHPRTRKRLEETGASIASIRLDRAPVELKGIHCLDPLGYLDFMALVAGARIVLTDSGGIQEETTALDVPCLTLRENTERPVTVTHGTNRVVGTSAARIIQEALRTLESPRAKLSPPPFWDGKAADRIVSILREQIAR